jgi:hypothetical protein
MLVFAGKVHDLRHLGFGYFVGVDPAFADAVMMHVQHDSGGRLAVLVEKPLQHVNHEFHWGVVVVQQQHPIEVRPLGLRLGLGDDGGAGIATLAASLAIVVARKPRDAPWFENRGGSDGKGSVGGLSPLVVIIKAHPPPCQIAVYAPCTALSRALTGAHARHLSQLAPQI